MKLLAEITEQSLGIESAGEILGHNYKFRKSARGVVLNEKGEVSIQFVSKDNYYKLPGGGVDPGETIQGALEREIREEVGCDITIEHELGITFEYRTQLDLLHLSYGFLARVRGEIGKLEYEQDEIDAGFKPLWLPMDEALARIDLTGEAPNLYEGKFIVAREGLFLEEAARLLGK